MKVLVTGSAGFIGFHLTLALLLRGDEVIGIDNINDYYEVSLKYARLAETGISKESIVYGAPTRSSRHAQYTFIKLALNDRRRMELLFAGQTFDAVCHLAAQAGVRYSLTNPQAYIDSNIYGFMNILEGCRKYQIKHLVYASSSSVYGLNKELPFSTTQAADRPASLYAATKKSNELMAHAYSHLFGIPTTGLRFFTVYGPWGRPDMALFLFTRAIEKREALKVFNYGLMKRDFTYIDDIISRILPLLDSPSATDPYRILNIGRGKPISLFDFITEIEKNLGKKAIHQHLPMQDGDVLETWADVTQLELICGRHPWVSTEEGVRKFIEWYKTY
ncbi:NAD-dependent epimerase/dehydratase family protein [Pedobacter polysacchareus]|uniref:NAD-dependent epimerase/dehydratase family protein n=1 Tax=Pedobacter polysacchareus TaxID=2861973 RepID=UPI001C99440A|nr:NAD-dependent epimerase/dehydratase family protein [Pedobacter polysacchareus]